MPRPSQKPLINCDYYVWRLFLRGGIYYADGRGNRPTLGKHSLATTDRDEALAQLRELDAAKAREHGLCTSVPPTSSPALSIGTGWDLYLKHAARPEVAGGAGPSTRKRYRSVRKKHERFCVDRGVHDWKEVTADHITAYGERLETQQFAPRTIHYEMELLKSVHKFLIISKHLPESLRIHLPLRRPLGTDTYCYRPEEVRRMLARCEGDARLHWLRRIILMLALTGFRINELITLRRSDIRCDDTGIPIFLVVADEGGRARRKQTLSRRRTKGRRTRQVPVHPQLRPLLASVPIRNDGVLFVDDRGQPITYHRVRSAFISEVIRPLSPEFPTDVGQVGFRDGRLHSFRHFFVSQALLNGVSEGEIRNWIGHSDTKLIDLYTHVAAHESRRRMEHLDLLGEQPTADGPSRASTGPARSKSNGERKSTGDRPTDEPVTADSAA